MSSSFGQDAYQVRFDWGPVGAQSCAAEVNVVVDVLSFSTCVTIAVERGMQVYPCRWRDGRAAEFARERGAVLAERRRSRPVDGRGGLPSLSPASLMTCDPAPRLVLPSPNGSTIAALLRESGKVVIGCLRNGGAVAEALAGDRAAGRSIAVVAAGERWAGDGSLRPGIEDHLGAGSVLAAVRSMDSVRGRPVGGFSPEADAAADFYLASKGVIAQRVADSVSGRELLERGFARDVQLATEIDASTTVPQLRDGAFTV